MTIVKYKTNIHCGSCIKSVTPVLNNLDNIDLWKVDLEHDDKILEVTIDDEDKNSVVEAVKSAGFEIEEIQ
ncbi:heavy-metal-associated domain-containing protein [Polaribacter atrinae]|uniref:Heavy metal-associated protein n=1 Tax=Polaribacter atrinae TaxID=1333662 RepID=A0A176TBC9_9FLAO|nr:heavy-metal-associated domain-containing protein [Polaribacter atrinae]OAD45150.1 heavy metal-associated protein [Polaribacter atrinae]